MITPEQAQRDREARVHSRRRAVEDRGCQTIPAAGMTWAAWPYLFTEADHPEVWAYARELEQSILRQESAISLVVGWRLPTDPYEKPAPITADGGTWWPEDGPVVLGATREDVARRVVEWLHHREQRECPNDDLHPQRGNFGWCWCEEYTYSPDGTRSHV